MSLEYTQEASIQANLSYFKIGRGENKSPYSCKGGGFATLLSIHYILAPKWDKTEITALLQGKKQPITPK